MPPDRRRPLPWNKMLSRSHLVLLCCAAAHAAPPVFEDHLVAEGLRGGYQVVVVDINNDRKPDLLVVASGLDELLWFENPSWQRHVLAGGFKGMINAAAQDIDGDGIPEIVLAHGFSMRADRSAGVLSLLEHRGDPRGPWSVREIDRLTTSHRLRWADIDGSGHPVLVDAPLSGAEALPPDYAGPVPLVYYRPGEWSRRLISNANEGVEHGICVTPWDGHGRDAILTASFSGIHLFRFGANHRWSRDALSAGDPGPCPKCGTSDVAVGRVHRSRVLAAIEPWHGNKVVVYRQSGSSWQRTVIDDSLADAHSIVAADLDGDRVDEWVVAQRGKPGRVLIYRADGKQWQRTVVEEGSMAPASCAVADLNGDRRMDLVCVGSTTANLKWYENVGSAGKKTRH
jgi:hypothetical protein